MAINLETFNKLQKVQLCQPSKALYGPARQRLKVAGQCTIQLTHEGNSSNEEVFNMEDLKTNLLGLPAIQSLQLIKRVCATTTTSEDIKEQYPKVFNGLGTLGDPYEIKLKDDAQPYALYAPRSVPHARLHVALKRLADANVTLNQCLQPAIHQLPWTRD